MTPTSDSIKQEIIPGDYRFVRLIAPFRFFSVVLNRACMIPEGFVYDNESVPLIRGTNPEAGAVHDYLCRFDSDPVVTKYTAAMVYEEFQNFYDEKESGNWFNRGWDWIRRKVKTGVVIVAPGYFHKFPVNATYEEIKG